jgi:hypothetical protein
MCRDEFFARCLIRTRGGGLRKLSLSHPFEQVCDGFAQDLPDVAVGNLMPHEGAQLFELRVRLAVGGELDVIAFGSERLGSRSRGGRRD